jgi:hypothetical protein
MSIMTEGLYKEAIVDVVGPDTLLSEPFTIKVREPLLLQLFHAYLDAGY